jgi:hypothetical protein
LALSKSGSKVGIAIPSQPVHELPCFIDVKIV